MFTGVILEVGRLITLRRDGSTARARFSAPQIRQQANLGDSICCNGVCLTVAALYDDSFEADLSAETLRRSTYQFARPGDEINLEPALRPIDRLGGHVVAGHVDGVGAIESLVREGEFWNLVFRFPPELARYIAEKGSIAIDGISLTVTFVEDDRAGAALIPFTVSHTSLRSKSGGGPVNLEADLMARYVERLLRVGQEAYGSGLTVDKLKESGFIP
ncbi:MAG: riboflavin synthase [bacterium]|nr:riboflavin synthase [bacterium]